MDSKLGGAELFLSVHDEPLIKQNNLFHNRKINYIDFCGCSIDDLKEIDLTKKLPYVQSVLIMCLMVAIYMGFNEIYLLGVEHDSFRTGEYKYFYKPTVLAGKDYSVTVDGKINSKMFPLYDELHALAYLWKQYRIVKNLAIADNIKIYNATAGGVLDEFERVNLEDVLSGKSSI